MISKLAMLAKKTIEAAWLNGSSYDLATQAAEALESAQLLQSPDSEVIIYRASWDSVPLGWYTTPNEARKHCKAHARRDLPTVDFDWIEDEEDGVAELVAAVGEEERSTGYTVTALEVASKYDAEADE
ncbi:hypothetical protein A4E84_20435 [Streptomyces qaidamensis]|uniref:Uncharacterized protein n=1 Tax=Streptomyces qaidamensis TaxID=1783515 RepID=A0A143C2L0_9ACTN|nr:hypothetical protein [Streptomyces qaidamensis]AMW11654.1 hypothetical protein A4E84_20435 [Streptomyces qaidamensis]